MAEFGTPTELLSKTDGVFTSMVNETGEANARLLRSLATSPNKEHIIASIPV